MLIYGSKRKTSGFTLIELLIAIAVISILAGIGLTSLERANRTARDGERRSDIETIRGALEDYYAKYNRYPPSLSSLTGSFLAVLPDDPDPDKNYYYNSTDQNQTYCIASDLEAPKPEDPSGECGGTNHNYVKRQND